MKSDAPSTGLTTIPHVQNDTGAGTSSSIDGSNLPKTTSAPLGAAMRRALSQLETMSSALDNSRGSSRYERIEKLVLWTEAAVQHRLEPEQRAILIDQLVAGDFPFQLIALAAYALASGETKRYSQLNAETWRQAMLDGIKSIGRQNKAFQQGYNTATKMIWEGVSNGLYDEFLTQLGYVKP